MVLSTHSLIAELPLGMGTVSVQFALCAPNSDSGESCLYTVKLSVSMIGSI
jgi:hypothetical protein